MLNRFKKTKIVKNKLRKHSAFLLLLFIVINSQAQTEIEAFLKQAEIGKCYSAIHLKDSISPIDSIYIEFQPPIYENQTYTIRELLQQDKGEIRSDNIIVEVKSAAAKFINVADRFSYRSAEKNRIYICFVETPARYKTIPYSLEDSSIFNQKISYKKVKEIAQIKVISKEMAAKQKENILKIPAKHGKFKEFYGKPSPYSGHVTIRHIQQALKERGYSCPQTGILDQKTKNALLKFQKDNGLREGRLGVDTFEKLGLY